VTSSVDDEYNNEEVLKTPETVKEVKSTIRNERG
jgi:hypothetical protein